MNSKSLPLILVAALLFGGHQLTAKPTPTVRTWRMYLLPTNPFPKVARRPAQFDPRIDPVLLHAAKIAEQRAESRPSLLCWRYIKTALLQAGAVHAYPSSLYAREAGAELVTRHGFVRLPISDPYLAPVGAVIVYTGHGPGHVEMRTENGFVSDFRSTRACPWQLVGVYARLAAAS